MRPNLRVIRGLVRKDFFSLLPLILLSAVIFLVVPMVANLDIAGIGGDQEFWVFLQANVYWLGFFLGLFLMVSVLQQDPAESLNHDWLTRPIARIDWLLAKLLFLLLFFVLPVLFSRIVANFSADMGPAISLYYSVGIESFEASIMFPLFLMMALLAPTLRKLISLMVMVFFVFLLPGWSVTSPMLAAVGIDLGGDYDALMWVQGLLIVVAGLSGAALIFWFHYCRRQSRAAYLAFAAAVAVMFLSVYTPRGLYNWDRAIALNAALINADNIELEDQVILEQATACFPAAYVDDVSLTGQDNDLVAQARWIPAFLDEAGPGALTIATPIRYREMLANWITPEYDQRDRSMEWRLDRIRSRAWLSAETVADDVQIRFSNNAENRYAPISSTETAYWLVPGEAVDHFAQDPSTQLTLEFDAVLLSPTSYELPVDGQHRYFPELGYCKAELDNAAAEITVECLKRGVQADLVSAHYIGMDSSRVDSLARTNLTNNWIETLKRQRYELVLESSNLSDNAAIIVSAYNAERVLRKRLVFPGLLGDRQSICPLPKDYAGGIEHPNSWSDKSSHEISYVSTERNVRLEVLDWRQEIKPDAPTLLLLPGLGGTAHSYDEVAEQLSEKYNVVGMTRRGTGDSSKPGSGYDIARLSEDVLQIMDALGLDDVILVGHSFGGEELSYLGANHPDRVNGLIYLDAAYDRVSVNSGDTTRRFRELSVQLPQIPPARPDESVSYEALDKYRQRTGRSGSIPEGEIIASYDLSTGNIKHDQLYLDALMRGIVAPDYENISVPALALYAVAGSPESLMEAWYDQSDPALQAILEELYQLERARKRIQIERFESGVKHGKAVILEDADHWIFITHEQEVLDAIDEFIREL